jgi:MFS family permease
MRTIPVLYLSSYALSLLGNSIAAIALPLLLLQTTGSLLSTGTLALSTAIPAFMVGLLAGVVIDRINRRTSSIVTDLISAVAIAALPIVDFITGLSLGWFILFGIIGAMGDVPGTTAREAMLPAIVRHGDLTAERMIGLRESIGALVLVIGPAAAGTLMTVFDGSTVLWITAATSGAAALLTMLIPRRVGALAQTPLGLPRLPGASAWSQLAEGWRVLFRSDRLLRGVTVLSLMMVVVITALQGIVLPAHFTLIEQPGLLGFVLTSLAGGTLVGGLLYTVLAARGSRRRWFVLGIVGSVAGVAIIAALPVVWVLFLGAFVLGLSIGMFSSLIGVLTIETIPEHMRGRIMGTQNSLMMVAAPLGMVLVAVIGEHFDLRAAGITMAALWAVSGIVALIAPALRNLKPAGEGIDDEKQ